MLEIVSCAQLLYGGGGKQTKISKSCITVPLICTVVQEPINFLSSFLVFVMVTCNKKNLLPTSAFSLYDVGES